MKHNMQILKELAAKNGPLCVGLDTDPSYIPEALLKNYSSPAEAAISPRLTSEMQTRPLSLTRRRVSE